MSGADVIVEGGMVPMLTKYKPDETIESTPASRNQMGEKLYAGRTFISHLRLQKSSTL